MFDRPALHDAIQIQFNFQIIILGLFAPAPSKGLQVQINTQARDASLCKSSLHESGSRDEKDPKISSDLQQVGTFKGPTNIIENILN